MKLSEENTLSKKLKRRIQELCGFNDLEREERLSRAHEILNSTELKQQICHKILGTTFKDIERAMDAIIKERQLTPDQEEEIELRESYPEKYETEFDPEVTFKVNKKAADPRPVGGYRTYTREEVAELLAAKEAPYEPPPPMDHSNYRTYSREEVAVLMLEHEEYLQREKERAKERAQWDSRKTSASDVRIGSTTKHTKKPSNSTRD